jgi:tetratricopeptide (TPR) repeat protein
MLRCTVLLSFLLTIGACSHNQPIEPGLLSAEEVEKYTPETQFQLANAKRAVLSAEKQYGPNSTQVAVALNSLGMAYKDVGGIRSALTHFRRALSIYELALGEMHLDVATTLENLADIYYSPNNFDVKVPMYRRILTIREKNLGPDHPTLINNLDQLAELYTKENQFDIADPLYERALKLAEKSLPAKDPVLARIKNNIRASKLKRTYLRNLGLG